MSADRTIELKSFDRVAGVYDETRGLPPVVEAQIADAIIAVAREVAPAPRIVEAGIGTGRIAVPLAARGARVTGFDISPKMLARLREKRSDVDVLLAEGAHAPFRPRSFDAALFVHILHLVPDATATVEAAIALVRPGGRLIYGGDDASGGIRGEAERLIREAASEVSGIRLPDWKPYHDGQEAFERACRATGATIETRTVVTWQSSTSADKMIDRLARKDFSSSWLIPDESLDAVVRAARAKLVRLFGGETTETPYSRGFSITVARLP